MLITEERAVKTKDLFIGNNRIRVAIRPGDKIRHRPLFIFNGLGANWEVVMSAFKHINPAIEVIAFDMIGTGSSSTPILPYSFKGLARMSRKLLTQLDYTEVHVLGISWGGALAQQFACMYPNVCKKLILVATTSGVIMVPAKPSVLLKMLTPLRYWSPMYMKNIAGSIYGGKFRTHKKLAAQLTKKIRPNSLWGYLNQLSAISRFTSLPWLKKIQQPTLVMAGDDDPIVPLVNAKVLAKKIPNATLWVLEGGGHLFLMAQQDKALPAIESFLKKEN